MPNGSGADLVRVDVAIVERPAGDHYLSHSLWDLADEQVVDLEHKPILDDNGFRVGLIGGMLPADLLALLSSGKSCADPHRVQLRAGGSTPVKLGGEQAHCRFILNQNGRATPVDLESAQCQLEIVPNVAEGGRMTLRFTPVVKHGAAQRVARPVRDPSGEHRWDMEMQQQAETYSALAWEVTISPDEYVVIGTRLERDDSLGQCFFLGTRPAAPTQRLLVIRSGRIGADASADETTTKGSPPPLALQAGWRSARGNAPAADMSGFLP
jgi:hypothetical protein